MLAAGEEDVPMIDPFPLIEVSGPPRERGWR